MASVSLPAGRAAVFPVPTIPVLPADNNGQMSYVDVNCKQDDVGQGYFEVFASVIGAAISLTNFVVIIVILFGGRHLRKATFFCICNLAVADLLAGILLLWIFVVQRVVLPLRTPETELFQKSLWTVTVWSSMLSQLVIAVDRYCCVTKSARGEGGSARVTYSHRSRWGSNKRKRFIRFGIALTWLVPIVIFVIPVVTVWNCARNCVCKMPSNSTTGVYYMVCSPVSECSQINPPFTKGSMLFLGLALVLTPAIPCVLYASIYHFARNCTKKLKPTSPGTPPPNAYQPVSRHRSDASQPPKSHSGSVGELDSNPKSRDRMFANGAAGQAATKRSWRPSLIARLLAKSDETATDARKSQRDSSSHLSASRTKSNFVQRSHQRDMRLLRTLTIILVLLLISTVPLGVLFLVSLGETDKRYVQTTKVLLTSSLVNSFLNPWIYLWRFREIRRCINAALRRCLPCCDEALRRNMTETPASGERRRGEKKQLYFSSAQDRSTKIAEHKSGARADSSAWRDTGGTSSNSAV